MEVEYKCVKEVLPNLWHHNVIVDGVKSHVIESSVVPMPEEDVIMGIKDGILTTTDTWVVKCP